MAKKEDPRERYAGLPSAKLDSDSEVTQIPADAESAALDETEQEMKKLAEKLEQDRLAAEKAKSIVLTDIPQPPQLPNGAQPDPYTQALLQGFTMIASQLSAQQETLKALLSQQTEGKQIPYNQIKPVTPWNPEGKRDRLKLTRPTYLSGYPLNPSMHTEDEIRLLNKVKRGRYHGRQWEVIEYPDGTVDIRYPNRTIEHRMEMARIAPDLTSLLSLIITEQEERAARRRVVQEVGDED